MQPDHRKPDTTDHPDDDIEACPDFLDRASQQTLRATAAAEVLIRRRAAPEQVPEADDSGRLVYRQTTCVDCGEDIPLGRLTLGRVRCVPCQEDIEKRQARGLR